MIPTKLNILFVDFYDSFSYNIIQLVLNLGHGVDILTYDELLKKRDFIYAYDLVILGPGPGHLSDYSEFCLFVKEASSKQRFLGICLGHQILGFTKGYDLKRIDEPVHGRSLDLPQTFDFLGLDDRCSKAMFYNSWSLAQTACAEGACIIENEQIVLIDLPNGLGLQFHPESVGTSCPKDVLDNALMFVYNKKNEDSTAHHWSL